MSTQRLVRHIVMMDRCAWRPSNASLRAGACQAGDSLQGNLQARYLSSKTADVSICKRAYQSVLAAEVRTIVCELARSLG